MSERKFEPYIHVEHSRTTPTSITTAAFTGAQWRFIPVPQWVKQRPPKAQVHWVQWHVRHHFRETQGKLFLFGDIVGYRFVRTPDESIMFGTDGKYLETRRQTFVPGNGRVLLRNKWLEVRPSGSLSIGTVEDIHGRGM